MRFTVALAVLSIAVLSVRGEVVDPESEPFPPLDVLVAPLDDHGIDVLYNHDSEAGEAGPSFGDRPRIAPLLGFKGWSGANVNMQKHAEWKHAFETGARGALAAAPTDRDEKRPDREEFNEIWNDAEAGERVFLTFAATDLKVAEQLADVLEADGYAVYLAIAAPERETLDPETLGEMFVNADHWLVIETASARLNDIIQFEADLLAELHRQDAWVAAGEKGLPPVKRGSMDVIESLGVLPMQVVPGGVVLGMTPTLDESLAGAVLSVDGTDYGFDVDGEFLLLENVSAETREAIQGFVSSSDFHSIADIAGNNVTLAAPFEDTRIGQRMARADRMPFDHLDPKGAHKSLLVDQGIHFRRVGECVEADVTLEVRFYRRDGEGHADRISTLRFTVQDATGDPELMDLHWSRPPTGDDRFNGSGTVKLIRSLEQCAVDAALIAAARVGK